MAGTPYTAILSAARLHLSAQRGSGNAAKTDKYWSDDELLNIALRGTTDLWAAIIDLHEEHFLSEADGTNGTNDVSIESGNDYISNVPADCFRVYLIEPRNITSSGVSRDVAFVPRDYNHPEFINARSWSSQTPQNGLNVFFAMRGKGAPNGAPTIKIAPTLSTALSLRFVYIPTIGIDKITLTDGINPIPGESDHAVIAWTVAYARAKEREDRSPDPAWLSVYATEKQSLMARMVPRQEQEPVVVDGLFDGYWSS